MHVFMQAAHHVPTHMGMTCMPFAVPFLGKEQFNNTEKPESESRVTWKKW